MSLPIRRYIGEDELLWLGPSDYDPLIGSQTADILRALERSRVKFANLISEQDCLAILRSLPEAGSETAVFCTESQRHQVVEDQMKEYFNTFANYHFEDGMDSEFSRGLEQIIRTAGTRIIRDLAAVILNKETSAAVASEVLIVLGRIDDPETAGHRRWCLEGALSSGSARIRYSAAMGLAILDDADAIPALELAIKDEQIEPLRRELEDILADLHQSK